MIKPGMPDRRYLFTTHWPPGDRVDSRDQEIQKKLTGDGESTAHMTATYWG